MINNRTHVPANMTPAQCDALTSLRVIVEVDIEPIDDGEGAYAFECIDGRIGYIETTGNITWDV